jgi:TRAP-type C4-dicarboxylate transport system permease small subunit
MRSLERFSRGLAHVEDGLAGLTLALVLLVVMYELTIRGLFGQSNLWTDELSRVLLIVLTYVSAIGLTRDSAHVKVELFVDFLRPNLRRLAGYLSDLLCLAFAATATWLGIRYVQESALFGITFAHSDLPFPVWVAQLIIPVGFGAITLRLLLRLLGVRPQQAVTSPEP